MHQFIVALAFLSFALAMADVWSTQKALAQPNTKEANPLIAFFMRVLGPKWILARLLMALLVVAAALLRGDSLVSAAVLLFNVALLGYVVYSNLKTGKVL